MDETVVVETPVMETPVVETAPVAVEAPVAVVEEISSHLQPNTIG